MTPRLASIGILVAAAVASGTALGTVPRTAAKPEKPFRPAGATLQPAHVSKALHLLLPPELAPVSAVPKEAAMTTSEPEQYERVARYLSTVRASVNSLTRDMAPDDQLAFANGLKKAAETAEWAHFFLDGYGGAKTPFVGGAVLEFARHHENDGVAMGSFSMVRQAADPLKVAHPIARLSRLMGKLPGKASSQRQAYLLGLSMGVALAPLSHRLAHTPPENLTGAQEDAQRILGDILIQSQVHEAHHQSPQDDAFGVFGKGLGAMRKREYWEGIAKSIEQRSRGRLKHRSFGGEELDTSH